MHPKTIGPETETAWRRSDKDADVEKIIALRAGNVSNLELFEYKSPGRSLKQPKGDDVSWYHLAFYTDDIYKSVAYLKSKHIRVLNEPIVNTAGTTAGETWVYFETPWGSQMELISYLNGRAYEKNNPSVVLWSPRGKTKNIKPEMNMNSTEIDSLARRHLAIWSERNAEKRSALIKQVYADDVTIIDPSFLVNGHQKLDGLIDDLQKKFPLFTFSILKPVESHHNIARLFWAFGSASKPDEVTGQDVFVVEQEKIKTLYVFIDGLKE